MDAFVSRLMSTMLPPTLASTTPNVTNVTTEPPPDTASVTEGFIWTAITVVLLGSTFVPIKKVETGDGMFYQWAMCTGVWLVGVVVFVVRGFPPFYPLAMLGGVFWATGNICVVPIIKTLGLSLGMLIWCVFNLMCGWASGRFGWFGLEAHVPNNVVLNYIGVALCAVSVFIFVLVKPSLNKPNDDKNAPIRTLADSESSRLITIYGTVNAEDKEKEAAVLHGDVSRLDAMSPGAKRFIGVSLSVVSGCLYGFNFAPAIYIQENYEGASKNGLDYVFNHFGGIYATAILYFLIYCALMKNQPKLYPKAVLPGVLSGVMWAVAQAGWFVANEALSEAVSFPIISAGPCILSSLWGVLVFREIQGLRNLLIMGLAFAVTLAGTILTALSKI